MPPEISVTVEVDRAAVCDAHSHLRTLLREYRSTRAELIAHGQLDLSAFWYGQIEHVKLIMAQFQRDLGWR